MGMNISSLESLAQRVSKYAKACGVKSIMQTKPFVFNDVKIAELKLKPLTVDLLQKPKQFRTYEVKVFNSLNGVLKKGEKLISPEFNGCHGVAVYTPQGNFGFHHFPPFYKNKLATNLKITIQNIPRETSPHVVFISPITTKGMRESAFDEYEKIIRDRFPNCTFKYYDYPNRTKGRSYTYTSQISDNLKIQDELSLVKRQ